MNLSRLPACATIGVFVLLASLVAITIAWETLFNGRIYQCSDSIGFPGFLMPGQWVHEPIACVPAVSPSASMSDPDVIKRGWTINKLWWAWWAMIAVIAMTSLAPILACLLRRKSDDNDGPQVR